MLLSGEEKKRKEEGREAIRRAQRDRVWRLEGEKVDQRRDNRGDEDNELRKEARKD